MTKMKKIFVLLMMLSSTLVAAVAQESEKSALQQQAEAAGEKDNVALSRYSYVRAYEDYMNKGRSKQAMECASKATALWYKENLYQEAFDFLRRVDQAIEAKSVPGSEKATMHYVTSKERMQMYLRMHRPESTKEHLNLMESYANQSSDDDTKNDFLYNKAIYHYSFGQVAQGNAVFKEMAGRLTASKEYGKVEDAYKLMIANARRSNNASMVAQSYNSYLAWKDSTNAAKVADERAALKKQIADNEASIAEKDSSLTTRQVIIVGLCVLAAALAAALVIGGIILLRFILLTRKQKKLITLANDNNALKAKFISNISAQLEPTLQQLDGTQPPVKALLEFSSHIQTLSQLENMDKDAVEKEDTPVPAFCESLIDEIRPLVKSEVSLKLNAPKMSVPMNQEYVRHILLHLLKNAAEYTPEGGTISLDYKKRGAHTHQFLVTDTGCGIAEEDRSEVFKPFRKVYDLTKGDGLGLPICKQMALKMNGDLDIDSGYVRGTRFVLELHA